jgi:hypothetical protein
MIVGVDFGAPRRSRDQRRKIIAIAAVQTGLRRYRVDASGMNAQLLASTSPGWTAATLADELLTRPARVVGFDFPFSVPEALLLDPAFASAVGHGRGAFLDWRTFSAWVASRLPLTDPLDFAPFAPWRAPGDRARLWTRRATDVVAGGQPPLKDMFQATFQMTLLGNVVLSALWESKSYRVSPFLGGAGAGEVIEVYPGATLRTMGLSNYKSRPGDAVRLGIAACSAAGIELDVEPELIDLACRYSSGSRKAPDYDVADAFVALCTAILHAEGATCPALPPSEAGAAQRRLEREGAIWIPSVTSASS